jgi:pseudouridine kinase
MRFDVVCIGGATLDRKYRVSDPPRLGSSNPATALTSFGGVAHNVAVTLADLGLKVALASALGADEPGRGFFAEMVRLGIDPTALVVSPEARTAEYVAVLDPDGDLVIGLADMSVLDTHLDEVIDRAWPLAREARWVFADCNMPRATFETFLRRRHDMPFRLVVNTVSIAKATRLPSDLTGIDLLVTAEDEAKAVLNSPDGAPIGLAHALRARGARAVIVTSGAAGLTGVDDAGSGFEHAARPTNVVDVTGAGDALIAATLWRLVAGDDLATATAVGRDAAALTIETDQSARHGLRAMLQP